nr:thiamine pyrophosphate-binding protein [Veillonella sp.]
MSAETINGARIVLETLHRLGVTDMFGYPGGAVIPIYDEIYSFPEIKHYFVASLRPVLVQLILLQVL